MEKKSLWKSILWASVIVQIVMSTATNTELPASAQAQVTESSNSYAWSSWSSWSRCSRTCGGGVSMQERQCLSRSRSAVPDGTFAPPIVTVRVTRQTHSTECLGVARRYHQCNIEPCPGNSRGLRAEQCAAYDRRPFRGHFYTWVPYIDGNSPCTLNCRPLGQQFYASLALVADGTQCTKPGYHAICVQGECKVVRLGFAVRSIYLTACWYAIVDYHPLLRVAAGTIPNDAESCFLILITIISSILEVTRNACRETLILF